MRPRDDAPLPAWTAVVGDALGRISTDGAVPAAGLLDDAEPLPFEELLVPFLAVAAGRLDEAAGGCRGLSSTARTQLERALLRRLAGDCAEALYVDFSAFRAVHRARRSEGGSAERGTADPYRAFVERMRGGGFAALLQRLPVLARIAGTRVLHWVDAAAALARRLEADADALAEAFGGGAPLGEVVAVEADLSDPHCGGRTVAALTFASRARVVYKPRPLALDAAFQALLGWLRDVAGEPAPARLRVLDRGAYGWEEHVAPAPCAGVEEAERFHQRAGMLLCLSYLLGGSDQHAGNLLARGADPVLVDVEVLFGTPLEPTPQDDATRAATAAVWDSVLRTHLLPHWSGGRGAEPRREGGLVHAGAPRIGGRRWRAVNTGFMEPDPGPPPETEVRNLPSVDGKPRGADAHVDALLAGFARAWRALARGRGELLAPGGPLEAFSGSPVRAVLRHTQVYARLLEHLLHPRFLASGAERSIEIDALCGPLLRFPGPPAGWAAFECERRDLEALDVPIFRGRADSAALQGSRGDDAGELRRRSGYAEAVRRLRGMDEAGLEMQLRLVRGTFLPPRPVVALEREAPRPSPSPLAPSDALAEAAAIADDLGRIAVERGDGVVWLTVLPSEEEPGGRFGFTGPGLERGNAGIALFLAACARETGSASHRELALRALHPLLPGDGVDGDAVAGLGDSGIGGAVYALVRVGTMLEEDEPLRAAARLAERIIPRPIAADGACGVLDGCAGAVLGLLALHAATGDPCALRRARACGARLLRRCGRGSLPAGFARGASGVAHALVRLHRATGDAALLRAAEALFAAEPAPADASWHRGAAGMVMARAAAGDLLRGGAGERRLASLLDEVERGTVRSPDHLYAGSFGGVEALLEAGVRRERPELAAAASARAAAALGRARGRGFYALGAEDRYVPGLLAGTAGIGYTLLRLHRPDRIPSLLLWD